jgi:cytidylate kinase
MSVITISRQHGSDGDEVADRVCKILGYRYFDKRLMARMAREAGLSPSEVVDFSEDSYQMQTFLERLFSWHGSHVTTEMSTGVGDATGRRVKVITPGIFVYEDTTVLESKEAEELDEAKSIVLIQSIIQAAYKHGHVLIVGRGGQAILADKPDVLHVRIETPLDIRVQRIAVQEKVSLTRAQEIAISHERAAADYLRRFYHIDWADPKLYHLVINTTKLSIEGAAQLIVNAVSYLSSADPSAKNH